MRKDPELQSLKTHEFVTGILSQVGDPNAHFLRTWSGVSGRGPFPVPIALMREWEEQNRESIQCLHKFDPTKPTRRFEP